MSAIERCVADLRSIATAPDVEEYLNTYATTEMISTLQNSRDAFIPSLTALSGRAELLPNAKIRRRLKRFVDSLNEKPSPPIGISIDRVGDRQHGHIETSSLLSFDEIIKGLEAVRSLPDLNYLINKIALPDSDSDRHTLKKVIENILKYNEQFTNKQIRRRLTRLVFCISDEREQEKLKLLRLQKQAAGQTTHATSKMIANKTTERNNIKRDAPPSSRSSSTPVAAPKEEKAKSVIQEWLTSVSRARSTADLEKALESTNVLEATSDMGGREQLIAKLNELVDDKKMVTTSKLKRRVTRLAESLQALVTAVASVKAVAAAATLTDDGKSAPAKKAKLSPPSVESHSAATFDDIFARIEEVKSTNKLSDLTSLLTTIDINSGNSGQRRKLKRTFEQLLKEQAESLDESLTMKIKMLIDNKSDTSAAATGAAAIAKKSSLTAQDPAAEPPAVIHVKPEGHLYIVFIGQLSFNTTGKHVEEFLQLSGIEGSIKVRMLTNKGTGTSKGQCFVELEGSRELNKCLKLDKTSLDGRKLNIELSTGKKTTKK